MRSKLAQRASAACAGSKLVWENASLAHFVFSRKGQVSIANDLSTLPFLQAKRYRPSTWIHRASTHPFGRRTFARAQAVIMIAPIGLALLSSCCHAYDPPAFNIV
jgi:hypothetical protein